MCDFLFFILFVQVSDFEFNLTVFQDNEVQFLLHVKSTEPIGVILLCDDEKETVSKTTISFENT